MTTRVRAAATTAALAVLATVSGALVAPGTAHAETIRGQEWWLSALRIAQAQQLSGGGQGVVVAVLDTGVYAQHPDLRGQVLPGTGIGLGSAPDGRSDQSGHGTSMASVIVGKGGGANHVLGIAPKAKVLPVSNGISFTPHDIAQSIRWAADHGAKVINISEGGVQQPPDEMVDAVHYALGKDVVIVASAGNATQSHTTQVSDPADIPGVIAVSATDKSNSLWSGSAYGPEIVLGAPGVGIVGASPPDKSPSGYLIGDGTSGAGAIVAGVAALVRSKYPDLNAPSVINRLIRTAKDAGPAGRDNNYGFGIVDPVAALTASVPAVTQNPLTGTTQTAPSVAPSQRSNTRDEGAPISIGVTNKVGAIVQGAVCFALLIGLVVLLVYLRRRSRRRARAAAAAQPPPGWGPPPPPPGWGPPQGPQYGPPGQPPYAGYPPGPGQGPPPGPPTRG